MNRSGHLEIVDNKGRPIQRNEVVPYASTLLFDDGAMVRVGDRIAEWTPFAYSILSSSKGRIRFRDLEMGETSQGNDH